MSWPITRKVFAPYFASLLLGVFALNLFFSVSVSAATLQDYKEWIDSAISSNKELLSNIEENDMVREREIIFDINNAIPASERIEWPGGSIDTENGWLAAKLKDFSDQRDEKMRRAILVEIRERLMAISEATGNLEKAVAGPRTKDEDKQTLAEILRREEYQKPEAKQESLFQKWWREFTEWLAKIFPRPNIEPGTPSGFESWQFGLQVLIFALVIGVVGFFLYKIAPFLRGRFRNRSRTGKEDRVILGERIGDDESASDLFAEAEQLARKGNLRGAIRKGYIALLCDLSDRKIVRLARHKTNHDYLRDVRKNVELFDSMQGLTLNFETNWYGLRAAEEADWEDFRSRYKQTLAAAASPR